jgi:hypothetical protein
MNGLDKKKTPMVDAAMIAKTLALVGCHQHDFLEPCSKMICTLFDQSNHERIVHVDALVCAWMGLEDEHSQERRRRMLFGQNVTTKDESVEEDDEKDDEKKDKKDNTNIALALSASENEGLFTIVHRYEAQTKFSCLALGILLRVIGGDSDLKECVRNRWKASLYWVAPLLNKIRDEIEKSTAATVAIALAAMLAVAAGTGTGTAGSGTSSDPIVIGTTDADEDADLARALALSVSTAPATATLVSTLPSIQVPATTTSTGTATAGKAAKAPAETVKSMMKTWNNLCYPGSEASTVNECDV